MKNVAERPEEACANKPSVPARGLKPIEYIRAMTDYLKKGNERSAYDVVKGAIFVYPQDILVLSYHGCLQAIVEKKYRKGVEDCNKALQILERKEESGSEVLYPLLYLNLGKAYVAAGKRKEAIDAFHLGLHYDRHYTAIHDIMQKIGTRKKPVIPFLDRSNLLNIYLGKIRSRKSAKKKPAKHAGYQLNGVKHGII